MFKWFTKFFTKQKNVEEKSSLQKKLERAGYVYFHYEKIYPLLTDGTKINHAGTGHIVRDDKYRRTVYKVKDIVYKVWGESYERNQNIVEVALSDFFKESCPALIGLIFDENEVCRGYVMSFCKKATSKKQYAKTINTLIELIPLGYYAPDCIMRNVGFYEKKPCLMDLETVKAIDKNKKNKTKCIPYTKAISEYLNNVSSRLE